MRVFRKPSKSDMKFGPALSSSGRFAYSLIANEERPRTDRVTALNFIDLTCFPFDASEWRQLGVLQICLGLTPGQQSGSTCL